MDIARLVLEYLQALIWPGITLTAILIFRKQLRQFLANIGSAVHRVRKFTAPGTTVELIDELSQKVELIDLKPLSEEEAQELSTELKGKGLGYGTGTLDPNPDSDGKSLDDLTRGKILRIWGEIEAALESLARKHVPGYNSDSGRRSPHDPTLKIRFLMDQGIITNDSAESLLSARTIRNQLVHGTETIPLGAFDAYLRDITKLRDYLNSLDELL